MKRCFFLIAFLYLQLNGNGQVFFPVNESSGKVYYLKTEEIGITKAEKYNRVKTWFINYYKTSRFEDHFKIARKGKSLQMIETTNSIAGKCGFYVMYPVDDRSGLVMEQIFVMFTMTISFTNAGYENLITDIICFTAPTTSGNMRPAQFELEAYNERQLNRLAYVQQYIVPQVNNSIQKVQLELARNIRYGNLTQASW
ncbi:MAG: hypothetical protein ACOYVG_06415 [Bacteroidota bacterium]|jgi:hypothetical protein